MKGLYTKLLAGVVLYLLVSTAIFIILEKNNSGAEIHIYNSMKHEQSEADSTTLEEGSTVSKEEEKKNSPADVTWYMKNVALGTTYEDLSLLKEGGITLVTTQWGMESAWPDVERFLRDTQEIGLEVVLDGGFSHTAWGYDDYSPTKKKPVWQKETVEDWIGKVKEFPHVYAYDIANEFGENLPVPSQNIADAVSWREDYALKKEDLRPVARDVRAIDPERPLMLRINKWEIGSDVFVLDEYFEKDLVDIVMLNLYTNWVYAGHDPTKDKILEEKIHRYREEIIAIDPDVEIWVALASFEDMPYFRKPSAEQLDTEIQQVEALQDIKSIGFFGLGQDDRENPTAWYLPTDGEDLWEIIKKHATREKY